MGGCAVSRWRARIAPAYRTLGVTVPQQGDLPRPPAKGIGLPKGSERNVVLRVSKDEPEAAASAVSAETGDPDGVRWAVPNEIAAEPRVPGMPMLGELLIESH